MPLHSYMLKMKFQRKYGKNNSICNCNEKNKISKNKLDKTCKRTRYWKLQSIIRRDWKEERNWKIFSGHGLEEQK